ncbi:MFS transporter [Arthrobacter sp. JUb115]|uniref:MFS transporter n=1 Tax=Arthrobacter sp. JUb115 TaxID=2485108 RepID=UPI0010DEF869|nr:MFS transporter [Arthrobacter sp. JUb115]TDU21742.1 MHS family proline/betaine transporter-like MFS transporter [Arthrobacter sp. JUb115]
MSESSRMQRPALPKVSRRLRADDCIVVDKKELRRAQIGAGIGNFIEWYDIGVYGYLAVTMTAVFTEGMDQSMGLLVTLFGFAVSFIVRPLGGMILGPLGDKIGRRKVMFFTIALMAGATTLIGLLPTAGQVGLWVIVPLYLLKMLQGFSTGGEYSGAATYVAEFSPDDRRGFMTSLLNSGSMLGFAAGAAVVAATSVITTSAWGENAMLAGGWRIPFLVALPLGIVAISLRSKIPESPTFEAAREAAEVGEVHPMFVRHNLPNIFRHYWPQILIGCALIAADGTSGYMLTSYMPTYLEAEIGSPAVHTAVAAVVVLVLQAVLIPVIANWSDKIGRRPIYMIATIGNLVLLVPAFALMHVGTMWSLYLSLFMVALPSAFFLAMTGAVMSELFPTASRYGGMGVTHNLSISIFGGTTPLVSQILVNTTGNHFAPAYYIMFFSVIALCATFKLRETASRPLLGSVPVVRTREEALALAKGQDENELLDTSTMLLAPVPARAPETSS